VCGTSADVAALPQRQLRGAKTALRAKALAHSAMAQASRGLLEARHSQIHAWTSSMIITTRGCRVVRPSAACAALRSALGVTAGAAATPASRHLHWGAVPSAAMRCIHTCSSTSANSSGISSSGGSRAQGPQRTAVTARAAQEISTSAASSASSAAAAPGAQQDGIDEGGSSDQGGGRQSPQQRREPRYSPLHHNIEDFCRRVVPTKDERLAKQRIIET